MYTDCARCGMNLTHLCSSYMYTTTLLKHCVRTIHCRPVRMTCNAGTLKTLRLRTSENNKTGPCRRRPRSRWWLHTARRRRIITGGGNYNTTTSLAPDSACVRNKTQHREFVFSSPLYADDGQLSRSLFCGHTRTRTRRDSRVLDECAGSRAYPC